MLRHLPVRLLSVVVLAKALLFGGPVWEAQAQSEVTLDEISVTSPSPIQSTRRRSPAAGPAPAAPAPAPISKPRNSPFGVLPVVTNTFSPVTVITQNQIAREQPRQLGDLLFDKPGISASTFAPGGASRPIIRGLDNPRVRIQENGIGSQDVSDLSEDHAVPINPLIANRVEVIRGPAALRYGSQAIGGVVSAENNRVPTFIPERGISGQVTTGYSTVDNGRLGAATVDAGSDNVAFHADGFKTAAESYKTPTGIQANSANESQGGSVGASVIGDRGFLGLSFIHYDALYQIPGGESAERRVRLDPTQERVQARGEYRPLNGPVEAVRFWFGASTYKHNEIADEDGVTGIGSTFKNQQAEGRLELQHVPVFTALGTLTGALGFQADARSLKAIGEGEGLIAPSNTQSRAVFLFEELAVSNGLRFQAAGRMESARVAGTASIYPATFLPGPADPLEYDRRREFLAKSASFGTLQDLPYGFVASLNGQYVERAPFALELFSRGLHEATATFEIGNPSLKLERARTVEASIRRGIGPLRFEATGYYTRYTGFIYKHETGVLCGEEFSTCGIENELRQIVYRQQNATFYGSEIAAQLDLFPIGNGFIGLDSQYDFVRAKFDDSTNVPRIPPHRVGGGVFLRADGWFARVNVLHAFAQTHISAFETVTPGWNDLRADLSYTKPLDPVTYGISEVTLGLEGRNLFNDDIRNSASFKVNEILMPGRNVRLFLTARF